jgi:hypothetical protein
MEPRPLRKVSKHPQNFGPFGIAAGDSSKLVVVGFDPHPPLWQFMSNASTLRASGAARAVCLGISIKSSGVPKCTHGLLPPVRRQQGPAAAGSRLAADGVLVDLLPAR